MDVLSQNSNTSSFNTNNFTNDKPPTEVQNEIILNGDKNKNQLFGLNPLLNESLNNLVKRLERTKIPKPPPTKGLSIRKKSKLSNSVPNLFLPSGFDDNKYCNNNEKKVSWTNKLNLNLERLKIAFRDTYSYLCQQKRSQSIPNLERNSKEENCVLQNNNIDDLPNIRRQNIYDSETVVQTSLIKPNQNDSGHEINNEISDVDDKPSFSTHVYLDGAIIEPISPASPTCSIEVSAIADRNKKVDKKQPFLISEIDFDKNLKPQVKKKGRPKKIQKTIVKAEIQEEIKETTALEIDCNVNIEKPNIRKKQKKLCKSAKPTSTNKPDSEINTDISEKYVEISINPKLNEDIEEQKSVSKINMKSLKQIKQTTPLNFQDAKLYIESTVENVEPEIICSNSVIAKLDEKPSKFIQTKKQKKSSKQQQQTKSSSVNISSSVNSDIDDVCEKNSKIKNSKKFQKSSPVTKKQSKLINQAELINIETEIIVQPSSNDINDSLENIDDKNNKIIKQKKLPKLIKHSLIDNQHSEPNIKSIENIENLYEKSFETMPNIDSEINTSTKKLKEILELPKSSSENIEDENIHAQCDIKKGNIENIFEKIVNTKSSKKGPKKSKKIKTLRSNQETDKNNEIEEDSQILNTVSDNITLNSKIEEKSSLEMDTVIVTVNENELVEMDSRMRLQNTPKKPKIDSFIQSETVTDSEVFNETINKIVSDSHKKLKPTPKSKKHIFSQDNDNLLVDDSIKEKSQEENIKVSPKLSKKGKLRNQFNGEEFEELNGKKYLTKESIRDTVPIEVSLGTLEEIQLENYCETVEHIDNELTKEIDPQGITDQSNDIEVLSKSLTDSVDTSMLPPRKRYKRLMYLDHSKSTSPKECESIEETQNVKINEENVQDSINEGVCEIQTKKPTNCRSRLKRKKQAKPTLNDNLDILELDTSVSIEKIKDEEDFLKDNEIALLSNELTEQSNKPSSLKRSKREAAARGFANMVAMSLNNNNNSQAHETPPDFNKKNTFYNKSETVEEIISEVSNNKLFKRPRKTMSSNIGNTKNKGKLSKSFEFTDEVDEDVDEAEIVKVVPKKPKISKEKCSIINLKEQRPSSPGETIISNSSSNQENLKYRKIRTNTYVDPKPVVWCQDVERCGCKASSQKHLFDDHEVLQKISGSSKKRVKSISNIVWDCTDNCLNKLTYTECNSKTCPCGDLCNNQKIKKSEWVNGLKVIDIQSKGRGVITTKLITGGTFITEYVGEVISESTFQERTINLYREDAHHYCLHLDGEMLIDAYRSGSLARFVNHSCQPNCEMQKWMVNGAYRMCLFANEDINPDTELTYDYNFCSFNTKTAQICLCGAPNCRGFIGGRPRAEQSESQKDRKKLLYVFGRTLSIREKLFIIRRSIFLIRGRVLGRCRRLGIRRSKQTHGNKLPSAITEIKRRKAKKNQFLTQMSALNSIRSIRTRLLHNAENNENLTRTAQLAQVLRDLYNTLLEQKDPLFSNQQLVAPFVNSLKQKKYPEFYNMVGQDSIVSLSQVYSRLLDGKYTTMMAFDQDILQMIQNIEHFAGKQSNIGKCAERIKPIYKDLKMNAIALYEALTDEMIDDKDKNKLLSNNLTQVTNAVKSLSNNADIEVSELNTQPKTKKRKQGSSNTPGGNRGRLERGAEVIKCVCGFLIEAGHVMVQCDRCFVWQHAYCMNVARSSELVDVTRMEPYFCHICLHIPTESLVREIPRHFVITDETVDSGNTLFWTLLHLNSSLLKIDDFVYIPSENDFNCPELKSKPKTNSPQIIDLSQLTIMRIYSLWKDSKGQRWMEGGLFLRPYNSYLKSISEICLANSENTNKRKQSVVMDLNTHKWHHQEVVYTELTRILPLDVCVGRCHVLNNHTFRLGKPLTQNNFVNNIDDVYLCDWFINKIGQWSEIEPSYLKINTKPYCFERHTDGINPDTNINSNEKFLRHYTTEDLLKLDKGSMESCSSKSVKMKSYLNQNEKKAIRMQSFDKLVTKLAEFAYERTRKLPLSPPSSIGSRSAASSRGASPLCENAGSKSPLIQHEEYFSHCTRKQLHPKKTIINDSNVSSIPSSIVNKTLNTVASEYSDNSPKLMIVFDEGRTPKDENVPKVQEALSSIDDKNSDIVSSSPIENIDERSNPCSEIKYGDLLDLLKETVTNKTLIKSSKLCNKKTPKKGKRKAAIKKNVIKAVSEINSTDDNWIPTNNRPENASLRRETRSRKVGSVEKISENKLKIDDKSTDDYNLVEGGHEIGEEEDEGRKTCFVKLERIRVNRAEKNKQRKVDRERTTLENLNKSTESFDHPVCSLTDITKIPPENKTNISGSSGQLLSPHDSSYIRNTDKETIDTNTSSSLLSMMSSNRSKRKKGVPKRIPFDFSYQQPPSLLTGGDIKPLEGVSILPFDYDVVDLSAGKTERPDQITSECQKIESQELSTSIVLPSSNLLKPAKIVTLTTATEVRHITAANDFSSIENISSN